MTTQQDQEFEPIFRDDSCSGSELNIPTESLDDGVDDHGSQLKSLGQANSFQLLENAGQHQSLLNLVE